MPTRTLKTAPLSYLAVFPRVDNGSVAHIPADGPSAVMLKPHAYHADAAAAHELLGLVQTLSSALDRLIPLARLAIPISGHPAVYDAEQALKAAEPWVTP